MEIWSVGRKHCALLEIYNLCYNATLKMCIGYNNHLVHLVTEQCLRANTGTWHSFKCYYDTHTHTLFTWIFLQIRHIVMALCDISGLFEHINAPCQSSTRKWLSLLIPQISIKSGICEILWKPDALSSRTQRLYCYPTLQDTHRARKANIP